MVNNLLQIIDLGQGKIQVAWQRSRDVPRLSPAFAFTSPFTLEDRRELRWYLEEYLRFPYGAEEDHARRVENLMADRGEELFKEVFIKTEDDPDPRTFYREAISEGLENCELSVSSEDPAFLNLPWELLRDPAGGGLFLAPALAGLYRHHPGQRITPPRPAKSEPFRVLLIIARPSGDRDIPFGTVARPMLEALRPLRPGLELEVLRPPTFDELQSRLNRKPGHYHLVHFDGHGVFSGREAEGPVIQYRHGAQEGHLIFERADGSAHVVGSEELGQMLTRGRVPLFVLNACQSAEEGGADPYASVASRLVAIGARGVVAMSYSVYAETAALFVERFYRSLAQGRTLAEAVAEGRRRLFSEPKRQSVVGPLELRDWLVPALYQQEIGYQPIPERFGPLALETPTETRVALGCPAEVSCPEGRFGFIGRDNELLEMERRLRDPERPWVLVTGIGGVGKTQLAFGLAHWFAETGGCPGGVFVSSFQGKADLAQVLGSILGWGSDSSRLSEEKQHDIALGYLRDNHCLLILDNFEAVNGYPVGTQPLANPEEQKKLAGFLQALKGGQSRVVITTRKPEEDWLGIAYQRYEIRGLNFRDAAALARKILDTIGRRPEDFRQDPDYARLVDLLKGHPRSLEIVLPRLRAAGPGEIIAALQHRVDDQGQALEDASLEYAFNGLSARARRHLPFIGLFTSFVNAFVLTDFVGVGSKAEQLYSLLLGESLNIADWVAILDEASQNGLIRSIRHNLFELHPTLPASLRQRLLNVVGHEGIVRLDHEFMFYYSSMAHIFFEGVLDSEPAALDVVYLEEQNLLKGFRLAQRENCWTLIHIYSDILSEYYFTQGRYMEWRVIRQNLFTCVGRMAPSVNDHSKGKLWVFLITNEANEAISLNDLDNAEAAYHSVLNYLTNQHCANVQVIIARCFHHLGMIERMRFKWLEAEDYFRKSLNIWEQNGCQREAASTYHELGHIYLEKKQWILSAECYQKAIDIRERLGLEREAASTYHHLGIFEQYRKEYTKAKQYYSKSLEITERKGLKRLSASIYNQLGMIEQAEGRVNKAEQLYKKALEIWNLLGLNIEASDTYNQLGTLAQDQLKWNEAKDWYEVALQISIESNLERNMARYYFNLGQVYIELQLWDKAEEYLNRSLSLAKRLGLLEEEIKVHKKLGRYYSHSGKFKEAENEFQNALCLLSKFEDDNLLLNTLVQYGVLKGSQHHPEEALVLLDRALNIAAKYNMPIERQIIAGLALTAQALRLDRFSQAWREAFDADPPAELIEHIRQAMAAKKESGDN
ncbi:MAG: tetratricopeptide repeat protein [Thermodesulfobacteriota bacterium]